MPRRKKNGQSPARLPEGGRAERGTLGHPLPQAYSGAMSTNFPPNTVKEEMVRKMQEMFSHLDPEVIYIVLSECDFKVENAMDSFLELSVAAEGTPLAPPPVSGFELTAAALLGPQHFSELEPDSEPSKPLQQPSSPPSPNLLTEELDLLVDQELETLTSQQEVDEEHSSCKYLSAGASLTSFPPPSFPQQALPELLQSSLEHGSGGPPAEQLGPGGHLIEHKSGASSPLDHLSTWEQKNSEGQQSLVDFTHLMTETSAETLKPHLDLATSGRPSAFQVYKKQDPTHTISENAGVLHTDGGARSKMNMASPETLNHLSPRWNLEAPVFSPRMHGNQMPAFITPVAQTPSNWPPPWLSQGHLSQAPLKPFATIPKSWALPAPPQLPANSRLSLEGRVLVLLRGAPGSGKSTLARTLLEHNPGGVVLSTDDYFTHNGEYHFEPTALGEAHEWNHKRAKEAFRKGTNPIIIDNTNMQGWEMKPYVAQALKHGYRVLFREADTWWKYKPKELVRRTAHNVHVDSIRRMLEGYERFVTVQSIMGSQMPEQKRQLLLQNRSSQLTSSEAPCPDLVGQPRLAEGCQTSSSQLFSSLPDVSSVGCSGDVGMTEDGIHKSTESLNFQLGEKPTDSPEASDENDDRDFGELDFELDAQLELNHPVEEQRMPDCIVESVMNEDHCGDEMSVAFSESIKQRVRRKRPSRRMEPADLVKDTNQLDSGTKVGEMVDEEEVEGAEVVRHKEEKDMPKTLNFLGDWPSEGPLKQREVRKRERHKEIHGKEDEEEVSEYKKTIRAHSGPDVTEAQKLLDLIQTGGATVSASSSLSPSLSLSSGDASEREDEADRSSEESHSSRSNSKERKRNMNRINGSRGDLPDCVLDWKPADSGTVRESRIDDSDGPKIENEGCSEEERNTTKPEISTGIMSANPANKENPSSALATNLVDNSKTLKANVCSRDTGNHSIEDEAVPDVNIIKYTENDKETDGTYMSEPCQNPVCEGSVETESSSPIGGGQEGKLRQGRRSGKQCKLALTFTQNCPPSVDCPDTTAQNSDCCHNSSVDDPNSNSNTSLDLKPNLDLSKSEAPLQPPTHLTPADTGCFTQTEPRDFALLWRLNHQTNPDDTASSAPTGDLRVLYGDSNCFVPELSSAVSAADAVHLSGHREVPYRVVHEKGTQVEEKELGVTQDRLESLCILSRHFKLVSFDTLEDLYDKCSQDLEWATNLLLDSGEKFFRDEDGPADSNSTSGLCTASCEAVESISCPNVLDEDHPEDWPKGEPSVFEAETQHSTCEIVSESDKSQNNTDVSNLGGAVVLVTNQPDAIPSSEKTLDTDLSLPEAVKEGERSDNTEPKVISVSDQERGAWSESLDNAIIEKAGTEIEDEIASMEEVNRLLQAELEELEREQKQRREETRSRHHLDIQSVELKLPTELALQLTELFGPVGVDPGSCSADDYAVQMDLNLAKLLHQKWKETIQERQRQAALSFHLLQESSVHWGESQAGIPGQKDQTQSANFLINTDGYMSLGSHPEACGPMPIMDHWNVSRPHVSLREIMKEEQALQNNVEKTRQSRADLDQRNGASLLKEKQLYTLFPTIDRHFLQDIFRDHNYSLRETELFLHSLLNEEPVKTVVAPEPPRSDHHRAASKERLKKQKLVESAVLSYQDTEDPEYEDFRAEARLQRSRQLESFAKAAEAYKQGRKEVASFYAQQGHLHGERMREANHRAAVQIFERVNSSLLPSNILDLHGLHVNEALEHLAQVLKDKTKECEQGLCRPQLSVITGRGNHSQGGVARIRPAVIDYLTNKHYRFTEPKPGLVLVSLK